MASPSTQRANPSPKESIRNLSRKTSSLFSKKKEEFSDFTSKFSSGTTAKQAIAEKINKGRRKTESADIKTREKLVDLLDEQIPCLYRPIERQMKAYMTASSTTHEMEASVTTFNSKVVALNKEFQEISAFTESLALFQREINQLQTKLAVSLNEESSNHLRAFKKDQITDAKNEITKWEQARLNHDALINKKEKSSRPKELEAECNISHTKFQKLTKDTENSLTIAVEQGELAVLNAMNGYFMAFKHFFEQGNLLFSADSPFQTQIEKLQQLAQEKKTALEAIEEDDIEGEDDDLLNDLRSSGHSSNPTSPKPLKKKFESIDPSTIVVTPPSSDINNNNNALEANEPQKQRDIDDVLKNIMERENRIFEEEMERQSIELRKSQIISEIPFEHDEMLKADSPFYGFVLERMTGQMIPRLKRQLDTVQLAPTEEEIDGGKALGKIRFGVGEVSLENVEIPKKSVALSMTDKTITIVWSDIAANLHQFDWFYKRLTFPKLKDKGRMDCSISSCMIAVNLTVERSHPLPVLSLESTSVKVANLDVKISGASVSGLYNALLSTVSNSMKKSLQDQLQKVVVELFEPQIRTIIPEFQNTRV